MAQFTPSSLLLSLLLPLLIHALEITGEIKWNDICPEYQHIQGARVILDDGRWSGYIRRDGRFTIPDLDPGSYTLSVISHDFQFDQLRVDVSIAEPHASVHAYVPGTPLSAAPSVGAAYPIILSAHAKNSYFLEREVFNPLGMFKSPMMILMLVTGALVFLTPYLMANLDEETLNEVKERQNKILAAQNSLQGMDIGGGLTGLLGAESDNRSHSSKPVAPNTSSHGKGRGKGRRR